MEQPGAPTSQFTARTMQASGVLPGVADLAWSLHLQLHRLDCCGPVQETASSSLRAQVSTMCLVRGSRVLGGHAAWQGPLQCGSPAAVGH